MHFHDCASKCSMIAFSHRYRRGYPAIIIITVTIILFLTCDGVYAIVWLESIGERICSQSIFIRTKMDYHRCFVFLKSFENGKIPIRMPEYSIHRSSPTYSFCQKTVRRLFPCQSQSIWKTGYGNCVRERTGFSFFSVTSPVIMCYYTSSERKRKKRRQERSDKQKSKEMIILYRRGKKDELGRI